MFFFYLMRRSVKITYPASSLSYRLAGFKSSTNKEKEEMKKAQIIFKSLLEASSFCFANIKCMKNANFIDFFW